MNIVELFSGSGNISKAFKEKGHNTFTVDIRKRKGICEPDLRKDIMHLKKKDIPYRKIHILWLSPPCDVWSYAAGSTHWTKDNCPKTEKCRAHIELMRHCLKIIDLIRPGYFFIENPRGKLRYYPEFREFLRKHHAITKTVTFSSYGFSCIKPTNVFTNALDYSPRRCDRFGRGAKQKAIMANISKCKKQTIPVEFAKELVAFCEYKPSGTLSSQKKLEVFYEEQ